MQYICSLGHIFSHPAKLTMNNYATPVNSAIIMPTMLSSIESYVCPEPECHSSHFTEYTAPPEPNQVENVVIYDLTTGPQLGLDKLLAEGYTIVNRYSKQYHLEKLKAKPEQKNLDQVFKEGIAQGKAATEAIAESTFTTQAKQAYDKIPEGKQQ